MDFHDFEKFNGKPIDEICVLVKNIGYNTRIVEIGGVRVVESYDFESSSYDYRLEEEGKPYGGTLIGHGEWSGNENHTFLASDEEWY